MKRIVLASVLSMALASPAFAAIEIDESQGFGPTYSSAVADLTIAKPLQLLGAIGGTALHIVGLPFSIVSDSVDESYNALVYKPLRSMDRCTGCSSAYDSYIKSHKHPSEVRFVVDGPSEITIRSDGVVVK